MTEAAPTNDAPMSRRRQKMLECVQDLPEPFPTARAGQRSSNEMLLRHAQALRSRLNWLVELEERNGDEQKGASWNRAERNALITVLTEWAPRLTEAATSPLPDTPPQGGVHHSPEYVAETMERIEELIADGFTVVRASRPGVLFHARQEDAAPVEVPLRIWFYMRGRAEADMEPHP